DGNACHGIFGKRRIENALAAKALLQASRGTLDSLVVVDIESEEENARVAFHFLGHAFTQRVDIAQQALRRRIHNNCGCVAKRRHWYRVPWDPGKDWFPRSLLRRQSRVRLRHRSRPSRP